MQLVRFLDDQLRPFHLLLLLVILAQGNKRAMNRLTEMKRMGAAKRGNISRPTRQQDGDDCIIS